MKEQIIITLISIFIFSCIIIPFSCESKGVKSCTECLECIELTKQIKYLEKQHLEDSVINEIIGKDYIILWKENQIFSSMLSEIENEPGGHKILKKLWDENKGEK